MWPVTTLVILVIVHGSTSTPESNKGKEINQTDTYLLKEAGLEAWLRCGSLLVKQKDSYFNWAYWLWVCWLATRKVAIAAATRPPRVLSTC